jgi:ABC-type transport system involved in multi-copper enzyme maturation permease subunit
MRASGGAVTNGREKHVELNPVFINELRQSPFRRKPSLSIVLWGVVAFALMWAAQNLDAPTAMFWIPILALPFLAPSFAAGTFAKEYEQQTWQDLFLTNLTNFQVVMGKFWAAMLQTSLPLLAVAPALGLIFARAVRHSHGATAALYGGLPDIVGFMLLFTVKLVFLSGLYVLIGMVCSRYSANRRGALIWNYIVMFAFTFLGSMVWQLHANGYNSVAVNSNHMLDGSFLPLGFMEGPHLLFCSVAGLGSCFLLWVSLSEQRGYKERQEGTAGTGWKVKSPRPADTI